MNIQSRHTFDPTGDILEIGLMAATSPDFPDRLIRALMAAADSAGAPDESVTTQHVCHPDGIATAGSAVDSGARETRRSLDVA